MHTIFWRSKSDSWLVDIKNEVQARVRIYKISKKPRKSTFSRRRSRVLIPGDRVKFLTFYKIFFGCIEITCKKSTRFLSIERLLEKSQKTFDAQILKKSSNFRRFLAIFEGRKSSVSTEKSDFFRFWIDFCDFFLRENRRIFLWKPKEEMIFQKWPFFWGPNFKFSWKWNFDKKTLFFPVFSDPALTRVKSSGVSPGGFFMREKKFITFKLSPCTSKFKPARDGIIFLGQFASDIRLN